MSADERAKHPDGVGMLQQVMKLLSPARKRELAQRLLKFHAAQHEGDYELLLLSNYCSSYLQLQNLAINQDDNTEYKTAFQKVQYLEHCSKPFVSTLLNVDASPSEVASYKDVLAATGANRGWTKLWNFQATCPGQSRTSFDMLKDAKLFQESFIAKTAFTTTVFEKDQSRSLYLSVLATLTPLFKAELQMFKAIINHCGVKLLYFVFRRCEERNARCIASVAKLLDNLPQLIQDNSYNLHIVCATLISRVLDYKQAGNSLNQVYLTIKSAFLNLNISAFTQKLNLWEDKHCNSAILQQEPATVIEYLKAVPEIMDKCIDDKTWPTDKLPMCSPIPKKAVKFAQQSPSTDIAAFQAQVTKTMTAVKDSFASLEAHVSSLSSTSKKQRTKTPSPTTTNTNTSSFSTNPHKTTMNGKEIMVWAIGDQSFRLLCGTGPYEYGSHQWGKSGLYQNAHFFLKFVSGKGGKASVTYNGNPWHWCDKCGKMTGHSTQQHKPRANKKRKSDGSTVQEPPALSYLSFVEKADTASNDAPPPQIFDADADAHSLLESSSRDDE
jgi:hypothetical protein